MKKRESRSFLATLSLVLIACTGCPDRSTAVADTRANYQAVTVEDKDTDRHEQEKQLALDRLRLTQEFQLAELKAKHAREIAALRESNELEIKRLNATHASQTKTLTESYERAVSDLKIEHERKVGELTDQINVRGWTAVVTGSLVVISWTGFGFYLRRRRTIDSEVEAAAAAWGAIPRAQRSVVDRFAYTNRRSEHQKQQTVNFG